MANKSRTIRVQSYGDIVTERTGDGVIIPGMLLERTSADKLKIHSTAGGNLQTIVALEKNLVGLGIDDAYVDAERVIAQIFRAGDRVLMIIQDGSAAVVIGDELESAGDGTVELHVPDSESLGADSSSNIVSFNTNQIVATALEALDASDSAATSLANRRILVEIV